MSSANQAADSARTTRNAGYFFSHLLFNSFFQTHRWLYDFEVQLYIDGWMLIQYVVVFPSQPWFHISAELERETELKGIKKETALMLLSTLCICDVKFDTP